LSKTTKQVIAGGVGILFAFIYGLWTLMATGGGHGNFVWLWLFIAVDFIGLYFPIMTVMAVDLRRTVTKFIFAALIVFNVIASLIIINGWMTEPAAATGKLTDYQKQTRFGIEGILFCIAFHFLPTLVFAIVLIKAMIYGTPPPDEDGILTMNLQD
jgi:hypothetical protein